MVCRDAGKDRPLRASDPDRLKNDHIFDCGANIVELWLFPWHNVLTKYVCKTILTIFSPNRNSEE